MAKRNTTEEPRLWERQVGETEGAWEAFLTYRDMEGRRTVLRVAEILSKSRQQITKWKSLWYWDDRVRAYDNSLQKELYDEAVKEQRDMQKRHLAISSQLQKFALKALESKNPRDASIRDIKEYVRVATELERLARFNLLSSYKNEDVADVEGGDVVIYVPDNGMSGENE